MIRERVMLPLLTGVCHHIFFKLLQHQKTTPLLTNIEAYVAGYVTTSKFSRSPLWQRHIVC